MLASTLIVAASAFAGMVAADLNYSTSGPLAINVSQISTSLLEAWCRAETNTCPVICDGSASNNTCTYETLAYNCTCASGTTPNISAYEQTIPFYVCEQWKANCVDSNPNDLVAQTACLSVTCGSLNASADSTTTTSSASASSTSASSTSATAASTTASSTSTSTSSSNAMAVAQNYGTGIIGAAMLAMFGLAL